MTYAHRRISVIAVGGIMVAFAAWWVAVAPDARAAGSGGGGSSACTLDEWTCGEWGTCDINSEQRRACTLTFDCPNTTSPPQPSGVQRCTPTCTRDEWSCSAWTTCGPDGYQQRTCALAVDCPISNNPAKPSERQACELSCTGDLWNCGGWSACGRDGYQSRTCTLGYNCPSFDTAKPTERQRCTPAPAAPARRVAPRAAVVPPPVNTTSPVVCGGLPTLDARVTCRLGLAPDVLARELEAQYLPEECRAGAEGTFRTACIARYRSLQSCWAESIGERRLACVRGVLGLGELRAERTRCDSMMGEGRATCLRDLRDRAYPYVTFRFYDLEERAEALLKFGAPMDLVAGFVASAEQAKVDFNAATSTEQRTAIIRRVQDAWRAFVGELADGVKEQARTKGLGSSS